MALIASTGGGKGATASRSTFVPSDQQSRFLDAIRDGESHLLLEARAGSGKSTTCREGARLLPRLARVWYACFNAHIAREFQADLPPSCRARTLHSFGLELLKAHLPEVQIDNDKLDRIAEVYFPDRFQRPQRSAVARLAEACRNLLLPADKATPDVLRELAAIQGIDLPREQTEDVLAVVPDVLTRCLAQTVTIDFTDMIWLPVMLGIEPPAPPDVLFVDEAQDLNACQHALVDLMCPTGRVVVVGDRFQSIYAFRGADAQSIPSFEGRLASSKRGLETYPLTVTRRCPRRHVVMARRLVGDLDYLPSAPDGEIVALDEKEVMADLMPGDMVLCRTNAPLVSLCYRLLRENRRAVVRGRDIGKGLLTLIARLRPSSTSDLVRRLSDYRIQELERLSGLRNPEPAQQVVNDRTDCLLTLTEGAESLDAVRNRCETLFSDTSEDGAIVLSSAHKAKGLERDRITIIRPDLMPGPWAKSQADAQQERNLAYVAATRACKRLAFAGAIPSLLGSIPD